MVLMMKNLVHIKPIDRGRLPKKCGLGQFTNSREGLARKRRGGDNPNAHYVIKMLLSIDFS